jgi:hypothetical protein
MSSIAATTPRLTGRLAVIISLAVSLHSTSGFALGTDDQRAACTPDVFRLCGSEIPNVDRIVACLKKEKPNLSKDCRAVFNTRPVRAAATEFLLTVRDRRPRPSTTELGYLVWTCRPPAPIDTRWRRAKPLLAEGKSREVRNGSCLEHASPGS